MAPANPDHAPEAVAIAILAKAPVPGFAKTRLAPVLGAQGAANLQARFIARAVASAHRAATGPVTLWAAPDPHHPAFRSVSTPPGLMLERQPDGDLGARMLGALSAAAGPALVIGTDCPALSPEHLRVAADVLRSGIEAVVIPVEDGGYALIGTRRPQPGLFADMPWGTGSVMEETRRRLDRLGLTWREPVRLWDVDSPEDLERMRREGLASLIG
jgi:rSAM/selenodomain-associated transferase 1